MKRFISVVIAAIMLPGIAIVQPVRPAAAAKQIAHLEWLPIVSGSACVISSTCPAIENSIPVSRGIRLDASSHAEIRLDGRFQDLYGTIYLDGSSTFSVMDVTFTDASNPAQHIDPLHIHLNGAGVPIAFSVRGVHDLLITASSYGHSVADIVASVAVTGPATRPAAHLDAVTPLFPASGTPVPAGSKVLSTWKPFPGAAVYALHIWLTHGSGTRPLAAGVPITAAATASGRTSYTWNDHGFPPGTYQYALLPLDATGNSVGAWSQPVTISVVA